MVRAGEDAGRSGAVESLNARNGVVGSGLDVAVKVLKTNCSNQARRDFIQEVRTIASFHHDNILHLIGITADGKF